jgi:heme/copper-type cytochrome/quinol oxidase subunit 2
MKVIAHSQVPKDHTYSHLGYTSAAAYNEFITVTIPRILIGIVVIIALVTSIFKIRKNKNNK